MKAKELSALLKTAILNRWAILLEGSPGIGKSDIVDQVVRSLGFDLVLMHPITSDPTDFKGLPAIVNSCAEFLAYGDLRKLLNATRPVVCFIDDLGQGSQAVQAALMQLVLAREINGQKISDQVVFIAATNRKQDGAAVSGLITPLRSRFRATLELTVDAGDWCKWAIAKGLPLDLIAFVNLKPLSLNGFDPKVAREGKPFACPRTVAFLGDWLNAGIDDAETLIGCVGESFATEFLGFRSIYKAVAGLPAQATLNPQSAPVPAEVDRLFAISAALAYYVTVKTVDALALYVDRLPAEFAVFFWKSATARKPELVQTNAFTNWQIANADAFN
jgi:hypothetical protein